MLVFDKRGQQGYLKEKTFQNKVENPQIQPTLGV